MCYQAIDCIHWERELFHWATLVQILILPVFGRMITRLSFAVVSICHVQNGVTDTIYLPRQRQEEDGQ